VGRLLLVLGLASLLLGPLAACAPRRVAESLLLGNHYQLLEDRPYGRNPHERLDVYRPRGKISAGPVVVFLYGGRWQHGSKEEYRLLGDALTAEGVVAVVPDLRRYPDVRFPAWVEDAARAVRWVRDSIAAYGGDPGRLFVMGHSSGAHTATLLALDGHYLIEAGVRPSAVKGYISLAGPVATTWTDPDVQKLMGPRQLWSATYPIQQVDRSGPPLLLLHGGRDRLVSPANSTRLAARIRALGGCAPITVYSGLGHVGIVLALALARYEIAPVMRDVMRFVRAPEARCEKARR
jgi:acetyl esterase/lipase